MLRYALAALAAVVTLMAASRVATDIHATAGCGLTAPAFCDTFDAPSPVTSRAGQLSPIWGASRARGQQNYGREGLWATTTIETCAGPQTVSPPNDIIICNGQLREAMNDDHDVAVLAMYPKQPFDFAGRTGTIAFDVGNDTGGNHFAWPEVWITDKPVPAPFTHFGSWLAAGQHAMGIRLAHSNGWANHDTVNCAGKWSLDSIVVARNYVIDDTFAGNAPSNMIVNTLDCVTFGSPTALNHVEVRVSQTAVDVWATDAGGGVLKHIGNVPNANLSFTRGLVWIQDAHYAADKFGPPFQQTHTFAWDNVGFDGPFTYRDYSYDVLDNTVNNGDGTTNLGWLSQPAGAFSVNTLPIDGAQIPNAASSRMLFYYYSQAPVSTFTYTINGHVHTAPSPFDSQAFTPRTVALDVPLTDLVAGPNNVKIKADVDLFVSNVNVVLVNVSGGAPSTPTPLATSPSIASTPTPLPSPTSTLSPAPTAVATATSTPPPPPSGNLVVSRISGNFTDSPSSLIVFPTTPASACKAGVTQATADNDVLACDAASGHGGQILATLSSQNYGLLSMRPPRPFDFAGRTGVITANVDAVTQGPASYWASIFLTDDPNQGAANSTQVSGEVPRFGLGVNWDDQCGPADNTKARANSVWVFANYVETQVPLSGAQCITTQRGVLNRLELRVSQTSVQVWASDAGGGNFRQVGSAAISLPFSRGYVHFQTVERAPVKYGNPPGYTSNYWSNMGFDGPVIAEVDYPAPNSLTPNGAGVNIGYALGNNPYVTPLLPLNNVSLTSVASAKLAFALSFEWSSGGDPATTPVHYRFNGGPWRLVTETNIPAAANCQGWGTGYCNWAVPFVTNVALSDLHAGNNTVEIVVDGVSNGWPTILSNVNLVTLGGAAPPAPTPTPVPPTATPTPAGHTYQCVVDGAVVWTQANPGRKCP